MLPATIESYLSPRLRATSLPASAGVPPTPMPSPSYTPIGTPGGSSSPRAPISVRRSFTGLSKLFNSAGGGADDQGPTTTAPSTTPAGTPSGLAAGSSSGQQYLQPSLMTSNGGAYGGSSSSSADRRLVQFPYDGRQSNGMAREPSSGGGKVNSKKVRMAIRLLEELDKEAITFNRQEDDPAEEDYLAHLLTMSLTSALASVPADVQTRVFAQSPQLHLLPQPGFRFEFADHDASWKERAADGLGKGVVWLWVSGLPVLLQLAACVAAVAGVVQTILIRLRVQELLEFYLVVFLRFLATSPVLEAVRNVGADVTWVFVESLRRGLGGVMLAQYGGAQQRAGKGGGGAR